MNIFYLDKSAVISAQYMCDKHVVKMILESAQLLCTAHHVCPSDAERPEKFYKKTHVNHPCAIWCSANIPNIPSGKLTEMPQCMPDEYKMDDPVLGYRNYYKHGKAHLHNWKNRSVPYWIISKKSKVIA